MNCVGIPGGPGGGHRSAAAAIASLRIARDRNPRDKALSVRWGGWYPSMENPGILSLRQLGFGFCLYFDSKINRNTKN